MAAENALDISVGAFVDELARSGVREACVCPGSRSTPIAMLLHDHPGIRVWMHLDERSASYFALGMAKASRRPVALLATSGTAAANFAPAVAEARYGRVPLVVLTADRPPELRELGAPQTIDQSRMYGSHAKWWLEMPLPEASEGSARHARMVAARAAITASEAPAGPVHLNFPFREPLIPALNHPSSWGVERGGAIAARSTPRRITPAELEPLAQELRRWADGIIVCGPQDDPSLAAAVAELASALGYPLLADPLSLARCGPHDRSLVVDAYDAFLRDPGTADRLRPSVVLRFGALPTSKPLFEFLRRLRGAPQMIIDEAEWPDPIHAGTDVYHTNPVSFCRSLRSAFGEPRHDTASVSAWMSRSMQARAAIEAGIGAGDDLNEPAVFADLARVLPGGATLYAGNSMPVRDLDTFFPGGPAEVRFLANRGANGIDGVVSSALGASAAGAGPLVLVIGDLSFYHDMNGLLAAKRHNLSATIVLINNDGGGIFSFLPQAEHPAQFEELFGTPHGLEFRAACELYGIGYERAPNRVQFRAAVTRSIGSPGVQVIEVRTERRSNVELHRAVWRGVAEAVSG
ncbi:MAG TPA: 2-succinyl-5-enolpyruvyl-6-hydroxy-3-cyclohexene-1-carboxylic-acid synthase [Dehalococcoidia bacterium]|nr:2-succinyl-5-enolpyruvyl-6-hydroxy-3-cyclohexene-1-carboxylic-acid synthase [Dehalococcoidia bacterium]